MMENTETFEVMIHVMELGIIFGIVAVVAFTFARRKHVLGLDDDAAAAVSEDARSHHG